MKWSHVDDHHILKRCGQRVHQCTTQHNAWLRAPSDVLPQLSLTHFAWCSMPRWQRNSHPRRMQHGGRCARWQRVCSGRSGGDFIRFSIWKSAWISSGRREPTGEQVAARATVAMLHCHLRRSIARQFSAKPRLRTHLCTLFAGRSRAFDAINERQMLHAPGLQFKGSGDRPSDHGCNPGNNDECQPRILRPLCATQHPVRKGTSNHPIDREGSQ